MLHVCNNNHAPIKPYQQQYAQGLRRAAPAIL